ncbi:hypothetical protein TSUD_308260 [Trifolium subterraneum]|nr:hypothetical protein TSUD_308260 [Trifolium subterraneum]
MSKLPLFISKFSFLLFLLVNFIVPSLVISQATNTEVSILLNLKRQLGDPPSLQSWKPSSSSPCNWSEINCTGGSVTELLLPTKDITAQKLPSTICDLKNLTKLDLSNNSIAGEFPTWLQNCSNLQYLDLSQNYFAGQIPDDIGNIKSLTYLNLGGNSFIGDVPAAIGKLSKLQTLHLFRNNFNGTFPKEIGDLTNLEILGLAYSFKLKPMAIPVEFGKLKNLKYMVFTNKLNGTLPSEFGRYSKLAYFEVAENQLTGGLPEHLCDGGALIGEVPLGLWSLTKLSTLMISDNFFSGNLPSKLSWNMSRLEIRNNNFSGPISVGISSALNLVVFDATNNMFSGAFPKELTRLSQLITLHLDAAVLLATTFLAFCTLKKRCSKKHCGPKLSTWRLTSFQRLDLTEINIFSSLTDNNLIGSGGFGKVYRIASTRPGKCITDSFDKVIRETRYTAEMTCVFKLGLMCTSTVPSTRPSTKEILQVLRQCSSSSARKRVATEFDITPLLGNTTYISSYKDSRTVSENEESCLYSV